MRGNHAGSRRGGADDDCLFAEEYAGSGETITKIMFRNLKTNHYLIAATLSVIFASIIINSPSIRMMDGKTEIVTAEITSIENLRINGYQYQFLVNNQLFKSSYRCREGGYSCPNSSFKRPNEIDSNAGRPIIYWYPRWVEVQYLVSDPNVNRIKPETDPARLKQIGVSNSVTFVGLIFAFFIAVYLRMGDWWKKN